MRSAGCLLDKSEISRDKYILLSQVKLVKNNRDFDVVYGMKHNDYIYNIYIAVQ